MPAKSPFPGMDPYLERHWGDIHQRLVLYACDQLQDQLPNSLRARVEERVFLESETGWNRNVFPDVRIIERNREPHLTVGEGAAGVEVAEPLVVRLPDDSITEGFIEIRDGSSGNRIVTVIEVLSDSNKAGQRGTDEYVKKQREILASDISLVEIDLLRGGRRVTALPWEFVPHSHRTHYHVCVSRGWRFQEYEIYPVPLREELPAIKIPLRKEDHDIRLNLQALIEQAYRAGRYDDIDYRKNSDPPLEPEDEKWADELLRAAGLR